MKTDNYKFIISAIFLFTIFTSALLFNFNDARAGIEELNRSLDSNNIQTPAAAGIENQSAVAASTENSGVVMGSYLNVRSAPWGDIIGRLKRGQKINIIAKEGDWYKIRYNGRDAYIHSGYIATKDKVAVAFCGYTNTPDFCLNVRSGPWGSIIGKLSDCSRVEVLGREGDWYKIRYNGRDAYIHHKYAQKTKPAARTAAKQPAPKASTSPADFAATATTPKTSTAGLSAPLGGSFKVGSRYGMRFHPILKINRMHNGVDIGKPTGTPLLAMGNGKVTYSGWCNGGGYMVKIKYDNGYSSTYMHCLPSGAKPVGAKVTAGEQVAKVNNTGLSTGSDLHLEIWNPAGQRIDPTKVL